MFQAAPDFPPFLGGFVRQRITVRSVRAESRRLEGPSRTSVVCDPAFGQRALAATRGDVASLYETGRCRAGRG